MTDQQSIRFDGRVAIVSGSGRGLGRAYAIALARSGAAVVVNDLGSDVDGRSSDEAPLHETLDLIAGFGGEAVGCFASVATAAGADVIVNAAMERFGRIDIVVNNAGVASFSPFDMFPEDSFDLHYGSHVKGSWNLARRVWPLMKRQGGGRIVNILSAAGYYGQRNNAAYSTSKAALMGLTRALALEGRDDGILVNGFAPGAITRMADSYVASLAPADRDRLVEMMNPDDPVNFLLFLAHDDCTVSGRYYSAMGGRIARQQVVENIGVAKAPGTFDVQSVAAHWDQINAMDRSIAPESVEDIAVQLALADAGTSP